VYGITLGQGRIRKSSGRISHSSPQLRIANEKENFSCPDSSQTTKLVYANIESGRTKGSGVSDQLKPIFHMHLCFPNIKHFLHQNPTMAVIALKMTRMPVVWF